MKYIVAKAQATHEIQNAPVIAVFDMKNIERMGDIKKEVDRLAEIYGEYFCGLELFDESCQFYSRYPPDFDDEMRDDLADSGNLLLPEFTPPKDSEVTLEVPSLYAYEGGVIWEGYIKHTEVKISTSTFHWKELGIDG